MLEVYVLFREEMNLNLEEGKNQRLPTLPVGFSSATFAGSKICAHLKTETGSTKSSPNFYSKYSCPGLSHTLAC